MKWGLIAELAIPGLAIGLAAVLGMSEAKMWFAWVALRLLSAFWIARSLRRAHFAHGFWAGFLGALAAILSAVALFGTYTAHHPEFLERSGKTAPALDPRLLLSLVAVAAGLVHGLVQGSLGWLFARIVPSR